MGTFWAHEILATIYLTLDLAKLVSVSGNVEYSLFAWNDLHRMSQTPVGPIECGLAGYQEVFNNLRKAINERGVECGAGLLSDYGPNGVLISLASKDASTSAAGTAGGGSDPDDVTPFGEAAGWHQITVVNDACVKLQMWVWGGTPGSV